MVLRIDRRVREVVPFSRAYTLSPPLLDGVLYEHAESTTPPGARSRGRGKSGRERECGRKASAAVAGPFSCERILHDKFFSQFGGKITMSISFRDQAAPPANFSMRAGVANSLHAENRGLTM
jgi:hypothetical protein